MKLRSFKSYVNETFIEHLEYLEEGGNVHQLHIEQLSFGGPKELKRAIDILKDLQKQLTGSAKDKDVNVTMKWDGAPAVFFGINPENGKFFISGKALFKANPRLMYTNDDIDNDQWYGKMPELKVKLKTALEHLPKLGFKEGIYQGDLMFTPGDLKTETINSKSHIVFKPNTITYAIEKDSELGKEITTAKMGVVIHTKYSGSSISNLSQSFNIDLSKFKKTKDVWFNDAYVPSYDGVLTFTKEEDDTVSSLIKQIESVKVSSKALNALNNTELGLRMETSVNYFIRQGKTLADLDIREYFEYFEEYVENIYTKMEDKYKTDAKKQQVRDTYNNLMKDYKQNKKEIEKILKIYSLISVAKTMFVRKFEEIDQKVKTFIKDNKGYKATKPEGFCAVTAGGTEILKLVDRLTFSKNNFNIVKDWSDRK